MAHPFKSQSDAFKGKAAVRVGKAEGGTVKPLPIQTKPLLKDVGVKDYAREVNRGMRGGEGPGQFNQSDVFKAGGGAVGYARGGKTGKKGSKININIISGVPGKGEAASPPTPMLPLPGPGAGAGLAPPGVPMGPPPMKSGGRIKGGDTRGKLKGGADTGVGRIQEFARLKAARGGK